MLVVVMTTFHIMEDLLKRGGDKMLVRREEFKKNGEDYEKLFFGIDEEYITGIVEQPVPSEPVEPTEPEPTESEMIQSEILLNQTKIISEQESQSAILAELMLAQAEREVN